MFQQFFIKTLTCFSIRRAKISREKGKKYFLKRLINSVLLNQGKIKISKMLS